MSDVTRDFTVDTADRRLLDADIKGSMAHVTMLGEVGLLSSEEAATLLDGLRKIADEQFEFHDDDEDVHSAVERRLGELVGPLAGKMHTARSRNDQVALDLRIYLADAARDRGDQLRWFAAFMADLAEAHQETPIPSYTHLQQAQITSLGNHLLAYAWMALRDAQRFDDARQRIAVSPLGAGASAGSSLPIDRDSVAASVGFESVVPNTLDAVGSRDFVAEYVFVAAQAMANLSRLAGEITLWASSEFNWLTLGDAVSTGSSALPQKRNPDIAELVRGRAAAAVGGVASLLALQHGLPLSYNRDFQEDKRMVFDADDRLSESLAAMEALLSDVTFHPQPPEAETKALLLAEKLVVRGVSFREAHEVVGKVVQSLEDDGRHFSSVAFDDLSKVDSRFDANDLPLEPVLPDLSGQLAAVRRESSEPGSG